MLMTGLANRYAHQLIQAREAAEFIPSLSSRYPLTIGDAYEIAARVAEIRIAEGENIVGRKLDYFLETSSDRMGKRIVCRSGHGFLIPVFVSWKTVREISASDIRQPLLSRQKSSFGWDGFHRKAPQ